MNLCRCWPQVTFSLIYKDGLWQGTTSHKGEGEERGSECGVRVKREWWRVSVLKGVSE